MPIAVSEFELRKRRLDFSSSGQGSFDATEFAVNGNRLINAIELLDFSGDMVQLVVCEACGITGCEPGSWASLRRVGDKIVFIPAIEAMNQGDSEANEYSPPKYMMENGPIVFTAGCYAELRDKSGRFPDPNHLTPCSSADTLGYLQLTAPGRVLGKLGKPVELNAENIVAVTDGNLEQEIDSFRTLIDLVNDGASDLHSEKPAKVVEFHLDIPAFPAWQPFGYGPDGKATLNLGSITQSI